MLRTVPTPVRALEADEPRSLLEFALERFRAGGTAIATLVGIRGGAARALGSHVVVAEDGSFAGFVSGGCVEAAVATEALLALAAGRDRTVIYGEGSPFFDIVLPCGGGITIAIHILRATDQIEQVLECLKRREPAGLRYDPQRQSLIFAPPPERAGWEGDDFLTVYRPPTRLLVSGRTIEAQGLTRLAACSGYDVVSLDSGRAVQDFHGMVDPYTAIALLHHDLEIELPVLQRVLSSQAFYIGALGSMRTHRTRTERLRVMGFLETDLGRIKAPIGMFGPTRDASSLAISVLADIAAARLVAFA